MIPHWQIVPAESRIVFTAIQNNAPVTGEFKKFKGDIVGDPAHLAESHVKINIELNSVSTSYGDIAKTLKTAEWFDVGHFPNATFTADKFIKTGDNKYQANGELMIKNKTIPTTLDFVLVKQTPTTLDITGSTILHRLQFGVGQGEWSKTDTIKDEVTVKFNLVLVQ